MSTARMCYEINRNNIIAIDSLPADLKKRDCQKNCKNPGFRPITENGFTSISLFNSKIVFDFTNNWLQKLPINLRMTKFWVNVLRVLAFVLAGVSLIRPVMALLALPSVIRLTSEDYAVVQLANRSWAWLEFIRIASFFSIVALFFFEREHNRQIWPVRCAFIAQLLIVVLYFVFTLPINITTFNWTFFPDTNWAWLRIQWEYTGAVSTVIGGISFVLLLLDLVWAKWRRD
jgi:hypothetical protein